MKISWDFIKEKLNRGNFKAEPAGFYIHFPFCSDKCPYCHFYSTRESEGEVERWHKAIKSEIQAAAKYLSNLPIQSAETIYFGGGTPSLLSPDKIREVITLIREEFSAKPSEITLEFNPESGKEWLLSWREAGLNRLSIGAQSFDERMLRILGRKHSVEQTLMFFEAARQAGFKNINLDLMIGLPGETAETVRLNLQAIADLRPEHVSIYLLEELENVPFRKVWEENPPSEEFIADVYNEYQRALDREGYQQYEISNFALPGYESKHNLKYWRYQPFVGLGPSAASHIGPIRWQNIADLKSWLEATALKQIEASEFIILDQKALLSERLAFGLRLTEGIDWSELKSDFPKINFLPYEKKIKELISSGNLSLIGSRLSIPPEKFLIANSILSELI